jgi:CMP-N,N'-diacetyllegionaminic acid synthase
MGKFVALIPARSGSERLPNKNILNLNGHPLISYSIICALGCNRINDVVVSTDSAEIAKIAEKYGAKIPNLRPSAISDGLSADIQWVNLAINDWLKLKDSDFVVILRPTNPLRKSSTIDAAIDLFDQSNNFDSLRAVREVKEHPSKMWRGEIGGPIYPIDTSINLITNTYSHSSPFQALEKIYIQDASLEICKVEVIRSTGTISGDKVLGFSMPEFEGLDVNYLEDLERVEHIMNATSK